MDPNEYLTEDFDISKLTIPKIRSILVDHQVHFPSNANKSELVKIFDTQVKPYATTILKKYTIELKSGEILGKGGEDRDTLIQPMPISDDDKTIPCKRQTEIEEKIKKVKRKIRKTNNSSSSDSANNSESVINSTYDENENVFKVSDKYKKKPLNAEELLAKIEQSIPGSSNLKKASNFGASTETSKVDISSADIASISKRINLDKFMSSDDITPPSPTGPDILFHNQRDEIILIDDDNYSEESGNNSTHIIKHQVIASKMETPILLKGPTTNLRDSIVISSSDDEGNKEIEMKEYGEDSLVSKLDIHSFSSVETDNSLTQESMLTEKAQQQDANAIEVNPKNIILNQLTKDAGTEHVASKYSDIIELKMKPIDEDEWISESESDDQVVINESKSENENVHEHEHEYEDEFEVAQHRSSLFIHNVFKTFVNFVALLHIFVPLLFLLCFREIQMNTGYCGVDGPERKLDIMLKLPLSLQQKVSPYTAQINQFESLLVDVAPFECKPCPENAVCDLNTIKCEYGYLKKEKFKSLFGLVPLQEYCEYDYVKEEKNRYLMEYTMKLLHKNQGRSLTLDELHDFLKLTKPASMNSDEFEEYWDVFIVKDLENESELKVDFRTREIHLVHKTPTEFYTRSFGEEIRKKKKSNGVFQKTPPTVNVKNYYTVGKSK